MRSTSEIRTFSYLTSAFSSSFKSPPPQSPVLLSKVVFGWYICTPVYIKASKEDDTAGTCAQPSSSGPQPWQSLAFLKSMNPILRPIWELGWNTQSLPKMLIELMRSH